jgi:hypothetical protein
LPQLPLNSIAPVPPQVTYQNGKLTILANNSTLGDILRAVHNSTGAEIEIDAADERVVTELGPGPAREVLGELLAGSQFDYVLLGSPTDASILTRVVLLHKSVVGAESLEDRQSAVPQQELKPVVPMNPTARASQVPITNEQRLSAPPEKITGTLETGDDEQ